MKQRIHVQNHKKVEHLYEPVENVLEFIDHLKGYGERTLFLWNGRTKKDPDGVMTYSEFAEEIAEVSAAIDKMGLRGERICIIGANSHMWLGAYLGILASDSVAVPLDKELSAEAISGFMEMVDATTVFYDIGLSKTMNAIAEKNTSLKHLICMGADEAGDGARTFSFEEWKEIGKTALAEGYTYPPVTDTRKMCEMLFTSGTTGTSKCVMLCQENIFSVVTAADEAVHFTADDRVLSVLPLHHTYELACMLALMNYGASCAINDSITHVLANLKKYRPTTLVVVPLYVSTFYKRIWNEAKNKKKDKVLRYGIKASNALLAFGIDVRKKLFDSVTSAFGGNLKMMVCGGAALNPALVHTFESFGISIYEGFGITECAPLTNVTPYYNRKPGSVGPAVPCCTVRIAEGGDVNEEGFAEGEIQVKGKNVMLGYYKNEEATKEAFTEDGWFRTGDVGYMDEEGFLFITGRLKSVIVLDNGKNVFPEEIEEYLEGIEEIAECVVVGRKDEDGATKLYVLIYPTADFAAEKSSEEMKKFFEEEISKINHKLPTFKQISYVEMRDTEFEKTSSRKIRRHLVK